VRPWLFAIARNRCRTMLAARRDALVPSELPEVGFDDLAEQVRRRAELRELITDLGRLAEDQRAALVLAELGDLSHNEIGAVLGCAPKKVKALVFQAREALVADRDARCIPCTQIRGLLETATGNMLRRASLRRHLRQCEPCDAYRLAVSGRRGGLAALLPVAPTAGLKGAVLGAAGLWGGGESASAAVAMAGAASGGGGSMAVAGLTFKAVAAKVAVTAAVAGAGVSGGLAVTDDPGPERLPAPPEAAASVERAKPALSRTRGARARPTPAAVAETPAASPRTTPVRQRRVRRARAMRRHLVRRARRQARAARRLRRPAVRRTRRLQALPRLRVRPHPVFWPGPCARPRPRLRTRPPALPAPTAEPTPTPEATAEPTPTPTPEATAEPTPPPIRPRRARRQAQLDQAGE
jgi:Sigma-70, region 4